MSSSSSKGPDDKNVEPKPADNKPIAGGKDVAKIEKSASSKSDLDKAKEEDSKYVIIGPDGVPYDPSKDPEYTMDFHQYRYPQYFTKHIGLKRIPKVIKSDLSLLAKGRIHMTREEIGSPNQADVIIFGGGIIGTAVAYFIKEKAPFSLSVCVIERDPTVSFIFFERNK